MRVQFAQSMLLGATLTLAACTQKQQDVQVPSPATAPAGPAAAVHDGTLPTATASGDQASAGATSDAQITLQQKDFTNYDATSLTYNFSYLTYSLKNQAITFANGAATLPFKGLPAGQSGTVTLDIYSGNTQTLHGTVANVTLVAGQNATLALTLQPVGGGSTSNLTVSVTVAPGTTVPGTGGSGGVATTTPGAPGTTPPTTTTPGTTTTTPATDPLAAWDGKSFLGNGKWTITAVQ